MSQKSQVPEDEPRGYGKCFPLCEVSREASGAEVTSGGVREEAFDKGSETARDRRLEGEMRQARCVRCTERDVGSPE